MKTLFVILLAVVGAVIAAPPNALYLSNVTMVAQAKPAGYVAPLDHLVSEGVTIVGAWSTSRRLLTSYTGAPIRLLADTTGDPEQDIGVGSDGQLDTAAAATFLASNSGYVRKLYDQSGGGYDWVQATKAQQPAYVASGIASKPVLQSDGSNDNMSTSGLGSQTAWWAFIVVKTLGAANVNIELWAIADYPSASNYRLLETIGTALYINSSSVAYPSGGLEDLGSATVLRAYLITGSSSGSTMRSDTGLTASTGTGMTRSDDIMRICGRGDPGLHANIQIGELVFGSGTLTTDQADELFQIAADQWGTVAP